jgi:argininosuccinate lyase
MEDKMGEKGEKWSYKASLGAHDSRLKKGPAKVVVDHFYSKWLASTLPLFNKLIEYNQAHVAELYDKNIISKEDAAKIIKTLRWIEDSGPDYFEFDPSLEDTMPNLEAILVSQLGEEVGGKILTGRARGEVTNVALRLYLRENFLDLLKEMNHLRQVVLDLAREHTETVMPSYTHAQHAQPSTFGHYLACVAEALETDFSRLEDSYRRINASIAEISIGQGTAYPIDRQRMAALLGFDGVVENTRYALLSWDRVIEVLANVAILAINLNRFSDDLFYWCTYEFNMLELSDEFSSTSYIMPQKKNPYVLEELACIAGRAITNFTRDAFRYNRMSFGLAVHIGGVKADPSLTVQEVCGAVKMLSGVVSTITVNKDLMKERSGIFFTQASELADTLVREKNVSFRTAHKIIGTVVREALSQGKKPSQIDSQMIDSAAIQVMGNPVNLAPEVLLRCLDPLEIVNAKNGIGGVAPQAVKISIQHRKAQLEEDARSLRAKEGKVSTARKKLEEVIQKILQ